MKSLRMSCLSLQNEGCHNINFVTPTHQMPMLLRSLLIASEKGLRLPIVYNCGGYESLHAIQLLEGVVDIYMPDFKYADPAMAKKYSGAENYPEVARAALKEMHRQVGDLLTDKRGIAMRGLLVRHLVLPEGVAGTAEIVKFIARRNFQKYLYQYHGPVPPMFQGIRPPAVEQEDYRKGIYRSFRYGYKGGDQEDRRSNRLIST